MSEQGVARGPALRATPSANLFDALYNHFGIRSSDGARDLGGSSNLNLLLTDGQQRYVVRVYRPWVSAARLADMQLVRRMLRLGGVPCSQPIPTLNGETWIRVDDRYVEVEPYVEFDAKMDSWERIEAGLPLLGRIHSLLQSLEASHDGRRPPAANYIEPQDALRGTRRGTQHIRGWEASPAELKLAAEAEALARLVDRAEADLPERPRQLVHGDYWDNNVLFRNGNVALVADLDFMGERARLMIWRSRFTTRTPHSQMTECRKPAYAGYASSSRPMTVPCRNH